MTNRKHLAVVAAIFSLAWAAQRASAQTQPREYPVKPVRIIVPTSPGGLLDLVVRILAQKMAEVTGQNVLVDNRPGASNNIGTELAARAPADGYAVLSATLPLVANPSLFDKLPFNVEKDFAPVSQLVAAPYVVVVHPSVPVRSIKELIALARAKPGTLNYSTGGNGTNLHMATELFRNQTGINIVHLAYKGAGPALAPLRRSRSEFSIAGSGDASIERRTSARSRDYERTPFAATSRPSDRHGIRRPGLHVRELGRRAAAVGDAARDRRGAEWPCRQIDAGSGRRLPALSGRDRSRRQLAGAVSRADQVRALALGGSGEVERDEGGVDGRTTRSVFTVM
jgi:hypothetical protein